MSYRGPIPSAELINTLRIVGGELEIASADRIEELEAELAEVKAQRLRELDNRIKQLEAELFGDWYGKSAETSCEAIDMEIGKAMKEDGDDGDN